MRNKSFRNSLSTTAPITTLCVLCLYFATGCSTVEGIGKDISKAGQVLSDASRKESSKNTELEPIDK